MTFTRVYRSGRRRLRQALRPGPKRRLHRYLPDGAVFVEAGAAEGLATERIAREWPHGHVHAFEPVPNLYAELCERTAALRNVSTWPLALGSEESRERMFVGGSSSSLLAPKAHVHEYPEISFDSTVEVSVTTLEAWAERENIRRIDGMWLDMQGYELEALKAAGPVFETTRALVTEVSRVELYEGCPLWPEVRGWLESQGFRVREVEWYGPYGDALVVR